MRAIFLAGLVVASSAARADRAGADSCAARLDPEARAIFAAAAPCFATAADPRDHVSRRVKDLVVEGAVRRATARDSATAAGACLKLIR